MMETKQGARAEPALGNAGPQRSLALAVAKQAFGGLLAALAMASSSWAFDASNMPDGLVYNGTLLPDQLWTPLVLVEDGRMLDPFLEAQAKGLARLQGERKTEPMIARASFLLGCFTNTSLASIPALSGRPATVAVLQFLGRNCKDDDTALDSLQAPPDQKGANPMPTLRLQPIQRGQPESWIFGVPGMLAGTLRPVVPRTLAELGVEPAPIAGVISRVYFAPLPVVQVDVREVERREHKPRSAYTVNLGEAFHRRHNATVSQQALDRLQALSGEQLGRQFMHKLESALGQRFGGIARRFTELGLVQGIDVDNSRAYDYVGVSRFGVETQAGPWRWVDVVWCWRSQAGNGPEALRVLRTSEPELYAAENGYFSETNPSFWPPSLVVSGFADLDRDKRMEVISSLLRPYGRALLDDGAAAPDGDAQSEEIWLRDSAIHAWTPDATPAGQWAEVYRTVTHEARMRELNAGKFRLQRYGKR